MEDSTLEFSSVAVGFKDNNNFAILFPYKFDEAPGSRDGRSEYPITFTPFSDSTT